ncbi:Uncharacterised protein [Mycobacteroides abscessus subsp. abscessus]|nr:Uncharacterised protein [Mycobacteroides abscessus subsp. abscessus]
MLDTLWNLAEVDDPIVPDTEPGDDVVESGRGHVSIMSQARLARIHL